MQILINYRGENVWFPLEKPEDIASMINYVATLAAISMEPKTFLEEINVSLVDDTLEHFMRLEVAN